MKSKNTKLAGNAQLQESLISFIVSDVLKLWKRYFIKAIIATSHHHRHGQIHRTAVVFLFKVLLSRGNFLTFKLYNTKHKKTVLLFLFNITFPVVLNQMTIIPLLVLNHSTTLFR